MTLDLTITALRRLSDRVALIELRAPDGGDLPAFEAGAHLPIMVTGIGWRQYSLVNDPSERHRYQIAVAREDTGRGGSRALHAALRLGAMVTAKAPETLFRLLDDAAPVLLIGGGIGLTPLLAMAHVLTRTGWLFELHIALGAGDLPGLMEYIATKPFTAHTRFHGTAAPSGRLNLTALAETAAPGTRAYVCGPERMISEAETVFVTRGVPIVTERFTAEATPTDGSFEIEIDGSGQVIAVPEGTTALAALRDAGVAVESSCEAGVCGSCRTRVLSGALEHHDYVLSPDERAGGEVFTPCVSRGCGRIVVQPGGRGL